ncbi:MAG: hypothetical protein H0W90_01385 [Actinobacteria bacterium]|nr:hypothetical protein [Actinomycetota bacterium]
MNSQDVALTPECEECGTVWLPSDTERWRAELLDDEPVDHLAFWCAECWERGFA